MAFPVAYFLIPFAVVALTAALFLFFNVFHILRFGIESTGTYAVAAFYVVGFTLILSGCFLLLSRYNWNQKIDPASIINVKQSTLNSYGL